MRRPDAGAPVGTAPAAGRALCSLHRPRGADGEALCGHWRRDGATSAAMLAGALLVAWALNSLYLAARADASLFYFANVAPARRPRPRRRRGPRPAGPPRTGRRSTALWRAAAVALRARGGARRGASLHRRDAPLPRRSSTRTSCLVGLGGARWPSRRRCAARCAVPAARRARERRRRRPAGGRRGPGRAGRRPLPAAPPDREPGARRRSAWRARARGRGARSSRPRPRRTSAAPIPSNFFMTSEDCAPLPQGHLRPVELVGPPLLVVQQPVVPQVDRVHAGRRRHEAVEVVRRLPRPRRVLQRHASTGRSRSRSTRPRRRPGSAARPATRSCTCKQHDGPGRLHDRVPAAARPRGERATRSCARPTTTC